MSYVWKRIHIWSVPTCNIQMVLEADGMNALKELLSNPHSQESLQECCYAFSNISAGNWEQVQVCIRNYFAYVYTNSVYMYESAYISI